MSLARLAREYGQVILAIVLMLIAYGLMVAFLPVAVDWHGTYSAGALSIKDPYSAVGDHFHNPPWLLVLLLPFVLVPERYGWAAFVLFSFFALFDTVRTFGGKRSSLLMAWFF